MIDRSYSNRPLTALWLEVALGVSVAICAFLMLATVLFWLVGAIAYLACWLWIVLVYIVLFAVGAAPALVAFAILSAAAGTKDGEKGAGCLGFIFLVGLAWFYSSWTWWSSVTDEATPIWKKTSVWAVDAYDALYNVAGATWDVFVRNEVYYWSWVVLAVGVAVTLLYLVTLLLARTDAPLRRITGGVRYQCPRCRSRGVVHWCPNPNCGVRHADVAPTRHGIWTARCDRCPAPLGTTGWTGLLSLPRECAGCGHLLSHPQLGRVPEYHVAVIGARGSGKTALVEAVLAFLEGVYAPAHGLQVAYEGYDVGRGVLNALARFGEGDPPPPTPAAERPAATVVSLTGRGAGFLLYLYDASGDDLEAGDSGGCPGVSGHDFHDFIDAAVLVVDPTAEEGLRPKAGAGAGGGRGAYDVLTRMIHFWQRRRRVPAGGRFRFPLAVVVTKMDVGSLAADAGGYPDLSKRIRSVSGLTAVATSTSAAVRRLLAEAGETDLLQLAGSHFRTVQYFGVTAQGRPSLAGTRSPFRPQGVYAPFAWLLVKCGAVTGAPAPVRGLRRTARYVDRCFRGVEGATARRRVWTATVLVALAAIAAVWWYLGDEWAIAGTVLTVAALGYQAHRARETG